jgi:glutamate--cysteine ligase
LDANTYYQPYATSLRISDIGYTNKSEKACGLAISYNNLDEYIASLTWAIETPCPPYEKLGVVVNGEYRQLNANILQIENEYYSSMRPKQIPLEDEKPILALQRRGVQYVELRSLDVNAFDPMGIPEDTLRFLEAFLVFCLFHESPLISDEERREIDDNQIATANRGRDPALRLHRNGKRIPLSTWAMDIMIAMEGFCEALDAGEENQPYANALQHQKAAIVESELTPSARILAEMHEHQEPFFHFAKRLSEQHQNYFKLLSPNFEREAFFLETARQSWQRQQDMETPDTLPFAEYLKRYFAQR